jgi:RHS repeat-associated protein
MKDDEHKAIQTLNPYRFTGREFDTDDLYYYRARYYDPTLGAFITPDPIGFLGGDMNLHRYVGNDPVNFVDYSGFEGLSVTGVLSSVKESICDAVSSLSGFSTPSASNGNGCAAPMGTNGCGIGGSVSTQGTIINAYFAEQAEREISTEPSNYTFKGHNNTHTTNQKKHIAERIYSNIKATNGEKYTTKAAIQEALTKDSYAKGESITFKRFKKEKYSKRINEASIGQKVNLVAVLGGMIDGQNITFKIHEKSPMLTSAGQQLIVLQNGVQVTEVKAVSKSNHAIAEIELRPRKEQKSSSTDTSPSLELWQEKFKHAPNTPEKFDHLWINVSSPSAKNTPQEYLKGDALKVKGGCISLKEAKEIALKVSGAYEGVNPSYSSLAGNFDGAGMSWGIIQFNFGQNTLGPLLTKMKDKNPSAFKNAFAEEGDYNSLTTALNGNTTQQKNWAINMQNNSNDRWKSIFNNLANIPEFQGLQLEAVKQYDDNAINIIQWMRSKYPSLMEKINLSTFVALHDLAVQQGTIENAKSNIIASCQQSTPNTQDKFIRIVVKERGATANSLWRADCISRRLGILNKQATSISHSGHEANRNNQNFNLIKEGFICDL